MTARQTGADRKEQIVAVAIDHLFAVGFEGFRLGDVARQVGINNATLVHHFPSKVALVKAVVERFTAQFEAVAVAIAADGSPRAKLARHMQSSLDLMRTAPAMFVVLNEIMVRARRDADIARLVAVPLRAWQDHIVGLLGPSGTDDLHRAHDIAAAAMAQLLGAGLLINATADSALLADQLAIAAITRCVEQSAT